jgi:DNA-binding transcriptional MocR family regulator
MCPKSLAEGLQSAPSKPKYIYINPNGANPTGTVLSEKRRHEIYKIACEHDLIILEDDPYYFVQAGI